eukprot:CCRYP_018694-RB/>CCRYP_018694-RB protein AED:0.13 eAED:0.13 QI:0/0.4/0.5/1/0.6/0.5/6/398/2810
MDPSEALSILPFATLSAPDGAGGNKKPSAHGRMTLCAPSSPCPQLRGVAFRFVDGQQVVQAVLISPPSLPQASDVGGDEEGHVEIDGGAIVLLGSFAVQRKVMRIACTPDGRLVLLGGFDGSLLCLDALFNTHNNLQVGSVQFTKRWECSLHSFMNSIHGVHGLHYDVQYNPDGSMIERRWSEENPDSSREAVENQEGGAITTMMFKFHSLEFIRHSFLAVVEWAGETKALWMDASTLDVSSSLNYWPLSDADFENDNADEIKTQVTCASARPLAEAADILHIAVGTNKGTVGILESSSTGKKMNFVEHPLFNLEEEENPNMPLWQVSHLHWFTPSSLAVGFTRVIVDMENEEDEDEEDDPNEHQANFLVASIDSQEDSPLDSLSWTWSELGDVVPFFSIPNGGRHAFHTVALPCNPSPSSMLLVGCNVGSDVVLLSEQNGGWSILDLAEGHQMMCPTDEDDEFLYLMGLTVVMLSLISPEGQTKLYPFPMLASTDGRLSTFAPYYRGIGQDYFSRLSEGGDDKQQSWDELCSPIIASSVSIASFLPMTTAERHESNNGVQAEPAGKCILSGLDLGLDQVENEAPAGRGHDDASDSDDSDYQEDDLKSSSDELDGPTDAEKEEPKKPPAFGSGFTAPSFTFAQPSFSFQPSSTASTMTPPKAGLGSGSIAGGFSFGSTGGATFGSPSTLGGPTLSTVKQPREPGSSASVFGSTSASTAFGTTAFSTFGGFIGFGDIKQSSASSGFGDDNQSKPQQNDKALMPTKKDIPIAPPFGSATEPPSFSFGSATEGFASGNDAGMNQGVTTKSNQSEAFGKSGEFGSSSTLSITHKNLFENRKNVNKLAPNIEEETTNLLKTAPGEKASKVFQSVLAATEGCDSYLHAFNFATLIDEIGEGFHGDELEHQLSLVDPSQSGKIERNAFIKWYCDLVNKKDDESSNDSEVAEERDNAANAFVGVARVDSDSILASDFGKLIESLGTTYCEEEHLRTIKKISTLDSSSGDRIITKKAFVDWYVEWLFGDGDSESVACAACETAKAGEEGSTPVTGSATATPSVGSIGAGGFSFGVTGSGGIGAGGFSFVAPAPAAEASKKETRQAEKDSSLATTVISSGGFTFGATGAYKSSKDQESKASSSGATFPPMSASAPKPLSSSAASSGSGFPPMSASSPTPFSSFGAKKEASVSSSISTSFPPMSAIAPKPFGSAASAPKKEEESKPASSGAAFPPMSASAPKPFSSSAASSGSGFPPVSAASPTPFSSFCAKKEASASSSMSSSFPPMSAIAPKPFGSATSAPKKEEENKPASSGAAFPPMSASAAKLFSSSAASSGSGFPHMSASSPTPFSSFGAKKEASASSSTSSSFPPMSAIAPKPFGSAASAPKKEEESKRASSGAAFPPMSASAPKPFSSSAASSGSGFPHMSASSPTPFSSFGAKEEASASSSTSSSFPPMSAIAPKPFGSAASAPKKEEESKPASSGAAFPPMSASAPKPFSSSAASSGSGFPHMSASSPTPFSSFGAKEEASASSSMSSSFPPMSAIAPKPFGSAASAPKKEEESKPASSGAAFPPMSASAPKPFSSSAASPGSGFPPVSASSPTPFSSFGAKKEASASSSMSSSFPPMSAIAPKPFGSAACAPKKKEENKPASSGAAFPPTSASAAKPFSSSAASPGSGFPHMSASSPTPFSSFGAKKEASASSSMSSSFPPMSAIAPKPFGSAASAFPKPFSMSIINQEKQAAPSAIVSISSYVVFSNYEKQLWEQVSQFRNSLYDARCLPVNPKTSIIESKIEKVTHHCQERISFADQLSELNADIRNRLVYLFSVEDDLLRQHKAAKNSINDQISKKDHSFTARNEPLDAEAEMKRRGILSKCIDVQNLLLMTKQCLSLNTEIFSSSSNHHQEPLRPSEYFNQWSFPKPSSRRQTSLTANNAIFRSLTAQYDRARDLHSSSETLQQSVSSLSESAKHSARLTPVSRTKRAPTSASVRRSISPLPTKHFVSSLNKKTPSTISSIVGQNSLMRDIISALQSHPCNSAKLFYLAKRRSSTRSIGIPDWKSKGKNELMPSSRPPATKVVHNTSPVAKTLFSSPIAGRKARAEWSTKSASASSTLQFNIPKNLQEINVTDAAKAALACQGRDIISRDHLDSSTEKMSSFTHVVPKAASGLSSSSPSAFPPMSSAAPKPLSQGTVKQSSLDPHGLKSASIEDKKSPTDYEEVLKKFFKVNAPEKLGDVDQYLQKYSGKEAEMFVALAKKYEQPNALNEVFLSRLPSVDKNNNLALLTLFLQVFNPARSGEASNLISKYKGKESEMFASLSRKYYACNPLQSFKTSSSTKTEAFETKETCAVFPPMSLSPPNPPTGIGKKDDCGSDAKPRTKESSSAFLSLSALGPKPLAAISECDDSKESKSHPLSPKEEQSSSKEKADTFSFGGMFSSGSSPFGGAGTASVSSSASTAKAGIPTFPTSSRSSQSSTHHKDYHKILTDFYQKHNPAKVSEVNNNLQKYKGKEAEMFSKLAQKYNAKNPLESDTPQEGAQSSGSFGGFASTFSSAAKSPSPFTSSSANQSSSPFGGKVDEGKPKSPFSSYGAQASTPFENASKTPFGTSGTAPAAPFGSAGFSNDGFGSTTAAGAGLLSQGSTTFSSSPFGSTNTTTLASGPSSNKFGGQNPRELLLSFYQTHNPSKLGEVDKTLAKYAGKEELMFLNLARKYNVDPAMFGVNASNASTTPPASGFGCSTAPTFGSQAVQGSSFGTPSFGSPAVLGGGVSGSSGNGGSITAGFGGFSGSSGTTFGSLAASNASPFSGAPCPAFSGVTTPFGAARR